MNDDAEALGRGHRVVSQHACETLDVHVMDGIDLQGLKK